MADADENKTREPKEEIPAFKFSPKKVDDHWKEEARKEREAAVRAMAAKTPAVQAEPKDKPSGEPSETPPGDAGAPGVGSGAAPAAGAQASTAAPVKAQSPIEQQQTKVFLHFIDGLAQQALMQLGELENPYTGQAEMDLQGARYTIELLAVILAKTQGNLSDGEHKALTSVLHDLKTHFATIAQEMQRQMALQAAQKGAMRPGPGGTLR